jgi:UDP-N-acetylmuramate--alanine ligase
VGVPLPAIAEALSRFTGVRRRFDILARGPILVVDDYAHHPTEMAAVLRAARQSLPGRRLTAVFQPHQHSRLRIFRDKFAEVLAGFDAVLVVDVYRARDKDEDARQVQSDSLVRAVEARNPGLPVAHTPTFDDALRALRQGARAGEAVIFMGAGDITDLSRRFAEDQCGGDA